MRKNRDSQTSGGSTPLANTDRGDAVRECQFEVMQACMDSSLNSGLNISESFAVWVFLPSQIFHRECPCKSSTWYELTPEGVAEMKRRGFRYSPSGAKLRGHPLYPAVCEHMGRLIE